VGDATEIALLAAAEALGEDVRLAGREQRRCRLFHFDPSRRLMTTVDSQDGGLWVNTKGAPEEILARSVASLEPDGNDAATSSGNAVGELLRAAGSGAIARVAGFPAVRARIVPTSV
jgi:magnesium-transporting ATPase (P-type)